MKNLSHLVDPSFTSPFSVICFAVSLRDADSMDPRFFGLYLICNCTAMFFAFIDLLQVEPLIVVQGKKSSI